MLNRIILRFPYLFWFAGLIIPALLWLGLSQLKQLIVLLKNDRWIQAISVLIIIQCIALSLSGRTDVYSNERAIAALHNIVAICFIPVGYSLISVKSIREHLKKYSFEVFIVVGLLVIISFFVSLILQREIIYPGVLNFIQENKFTEVRVNRPEKSILDFFPRSSILGIYPNTTAFILFSLHSLNAALRTGISDQKERMVGFVVLIIAIFMTGSRIFLLFSIVMFFLSFFRSQKQIKRLLYAAPVILLVGYIAFYLMSMVRHGSNSTRAIIMLESWKYYWETAPIIGLGIKPILPEVLQGMKYPVGSHSSILGFFVKSGIVGGLTSIVLMIIPVVKWVKYIWKCTFKNGNFNCDRIFSSFSFILLLSSLMVEDIDAYMLTALYFGMMLFLFKETVEQ